jgi:hypothetical protein
MNTNFVVHFEQFANTRRGVCNFINAHVPSLDRSDKSMLLNEHRVDMTSVCSFTSRS